MSNNNKKNEFLLGESYNILTQFIDQKDLSIYEINNDNTSDNIYQNLTEINNATNITESTIYSSTIPD